MEMAGKMLEIQGKGNSYEERERERERKREDFGGGGRLVECVVRSERIGRDWRRWRTECWRFKRKAKRKR